MGITEPLKSRVQDELNGGASLNSIAKAAGVEYGSLHRWVNGKSGITTETADKLARYFNLTLCDDDPPKERKK